MFKPFGNMLKFPDGRVIKKNANGVWIDQNTGSRFNDNMVRDMYFSSLYNTDIPDGGVGKPHRYTPAFDINFISMSSRQDLLNSGFTFDRTGLATYIDSSGVLRYAPHNLFYNTTFSGITKGETNTTLSTSTGWSYSLNSVAGAGATSVAVFNTNGIVGISADNGRMSLGRSTLIPIFGRRFAISADVSDLTPTDLPLNQIIGTAANNNPEWYIDGILQLSGSCAPGKSNFTTTVVVTGVSLSGDTVRVGIGASSNSTGSANFSNFRCAYFNGSPNITYYENTSTTIERHEPRFDYELYTGRARGFLLEGFATNLAASLGITAAWGRNNVNPLVTAVTGPNGLNIDLANSGVEMVSAGTTFSESVRISYARTPPGSEGSQGSRTFSVWLKAAPNGITNASLSIVGGTFAPSIVNVSQEGYPVTLIRGTTAADLPSGSTLTAYVVAKGLTSNYWSRISIARGETLSTAPVDSIVIHFGEINTRNNVPAGQTLVVAFPQFETGECMTSTIIPHLNTGSNNNRASEFALMSSVPGLNLLNGTFLYGAEHQTDLSGYNRIFVLAGTPFNSSGLSGAVSIGIYAGVCGGFRTNPLRVSQPFMNAESIDTANPIAGTYFQTVNGYISENTPYKLAFMYSKAEIYFTNKNLGLETAIPVGSQSVFPGSTISTIYFEGLNSVFLRRHWIQSLRYYPRLIPKGLLQRWSSS